MSILHNPWIGPNYKDSAEKIAILGYSHYLSGGHDYDDMTTDIVNSITDEAHIDHTANKETPFFKKISGFFRDKNQASFWNDVIFLNFVTEAVGQRGEKYKWASHEMAVAGSERVLDVLIKNDVEKLFVFSDKAWRGLPTTILEKKDVSFGTTNPHGFNVFVRAPKTIAFHLRHPQNAKPEELKKLGEAVELGMKQSPSELHAAIEWAKGD